MELDSLLITQFVLRQRITCTELFWIILEVQQFLLPKYDFKLYNISSASNQVVDALTNFYI